MLIFVHVIYDNKNIVQYISVLNIYINLIQGVTYNTRGSKEKKYEKT